MTWIAALKHIGGIIGAVIALRVAPKAEADAKCLDIPENLDEPAYMPEYGEAIPGTGSRLWTTNSRDGVEDVS
jgi:gas vesicle protein